MTQMVDTLGIAPFAARGLARLATLACRRGTLPVAVGVPRHVELLQQVLAVGRGGRRESGLDWDPAHRRGTDNACRDHGSSALAERHWRGHGFHFDETNGAGVILPHRQVKSP